MDGELWQRELQRIAIETDAAEELRQAAHRQNTPSAIYRPRIFHDGNAWMAVLGDDIAIGVVGCGDTPEQAFADFDRAWRATVPSRSPRREAP